MNFDGPNNERPNCDGPMDSIYLGLINQKFTSWVKTGAQFKIFEGGPSLRMNFGRRARQIVESRKVWCPPNFPRVELSFRAESRGFAGCSRGIS
jgi:hypothetical protein